MDKPIDIKIKLLHPDAKMPVRKTSGASGWDVASYTRKVIPPEGACCVKLGFALEIPPGYEIQMRPRSGMALSFVVGVLGTIDSDYRGEVGAILYNHRTIRFVVEPGDRIAQMVLAPVPAAQLVLVEGELSPTERGTGGYGSTGVK